MTVRDAVELFRKHQTIAVKKSTRKNYRGFLEQLQTSLSDREVDSLSADEISRHLRYAQLKAFFNYVIDVTGTNIKNPCSAPLVLKAFRNVPHKPRKILDKETVDEIIFNSTNTRDRLILELQARCGLRVGEVLNLRVSDLSGRKILIQDPKSGRDTEVAFMPEHIAARLADYAASQKRSSDDRVFRVGYTTVRNLVTRLGMKLNVKISPHDLRRHSATYASRNGVPLEIISKVILRHQDLKTTQVYLGKISDSEAIRWMDILHGR